MSEVESACSRSQTLYQREIFLWAACQLLFISIEMCQTVKGNEMAGGMKTRISKRIFLSVCFYKIYLSLRIWKQNICSNNSLAASWKSFNTMKLSQAERRMVKAEKTSLCPHSSRLRCSSLEGTDLHWFCDKWIKLCFNLIGAFAVLRAKCMKPWRLKTCCQDGDRVMLDSLVCSFLQVGHRWAISLNYASYSHKASLHHWRVHLQMCTHFGMSERERECVWQRERERESESESLFPSRFS